MKLSELNDKFAEFIAYVILIHTVSIFVRNITGRSGIDDLTSGKVFAIWFFYSFVIVLLVPWLKSTSIVSRYLYILPKDVCFDFQSLEITYEVNGRSKVIRFFKFKDKLLELTDWCEMWFKSFIVTLNKAFSIIINKFKNK